MKKRVIETRNKLRLKRRTLVDLSVDEMEGAGGGHDPTQCPTEPATCPATCADTCRATCGGTCGTCDGDYTCDVGFCDPDTMSPDDCS